MNIRPGQLIIWVPEPRSCPRSLSDWKILAIQSLSRLGGFFFFSGSLTRHLGQLGDSIREILMHGPTVRLSISTVWTIQPMVTITIVRSQVITHT